MPTTTGIPRHMPGPATSAPFNTSFSPWAPASIAAIDTLRWITRLGPATGIHLAVASRHRDAPLVADEFIDNINGHWSTAPYETSYPSTHVSVGAFQQQQILRDGSRAHAATVQAHATAMDAIFIDAARTAQHLVNTPAL